MDLVFLIVTFLKLYNRSIGAVLIQYKRHIGLALIRGHVQVSGYHSSQLSVSSSCNLFYFPKTFLSIIKRVCKLLLSIN